MLQTRKHRLTALLAHFGCSGQEVLEKRREASFLSNDTRVVNFGEEKSSESMALHKSGNGLWSVFSLGNFWYELSKQLLGEKMAEFVKNKAKVC